MAQKETSPRIEVRYEFFPTAWATGVSRRVFELLVGPEKIYPATRWDNEGRKKLPTNHDELIDWLTDWYEASPKSTRIPLFTDIPNDAF